MHSTQTIRVGTTYALSMDPVDRRLERAHAEYDLVVDANYDPECILSILSDEPSRTILNALENPKTAAELATTCGISQTSVYRKLDRLREASVVTPRLDVNVDGHHVWRYGSNIDDVTVIFDATDLARLDIELDREG